MSKKHEAEARNRTEIRGQATRKDWSSSDHGFFEGYLAALSGPSVRALVEALEYISKFLGYCPYHTDKDWEFLLNEITVPMSEEAKKALAAWRGKPDGMDEE